MIPVLTNVNEISIEHEVVGITQLAGARAKVSPLLQQNRLTTGDIELQHPMVARVYDPKMILFVDGQVLRTLELQRTIPRGCPIPTDTGRPPRISERGPSSPYSDT